MAAPIAQTVGQQVAGLLPDDPHIAPPPDSSPVRQMRLWLKKCRYPQRRGQDPVEQRRKQRVERRHCGRARRSGGALRRANLQDYYRDMEGSTILSDSGRYAQDVARDIEEAHYLGPLFGGSSERY